MMTEIDIDKLPEELTADRNVIECNFVMALYKDPTLLNEYRNVVNGEDIIHPDGIFYMSLLQNMINAGYETIDNLSVYSYLEGLPKMKKHFEKRGGWNTIKEISELISINNIDKYYDDLCKSNLLIRLYQNNFPVLKLLEKFHEMSAEDIYDYYEYKLADISIGKIEKLQAVNLSDHYEPWIDEWDQGGEVGYATSSRMLNYMTLGIHRQNFMLHCAGIGTGKTTSAISWYIIPAIEAGENVVVIANEQNESSWRQMVLATIVFNKIDKRTKDFDRQKMLKGHYTEDQRESMKLAVQWLQAQKGHITFIETQDYSVTNMKKIVTRYSKRGVGLFIVDTLKNMNDASDRAWAEFIETAKALFLQAKRDDVAIVATAQLSPEGMTRKYLDLTCIGKAKGIAETANTVVMFRPLSDKEKDKLKPYHWDGKMKVEISLDPNKDYIMVFIPKNRYGATYPQIIMERNMNFNSYKDVGWYNQDYDR